MPARETWKRFSSYYDSYVKDFSTDLAFYAHAATSKDRILEVGCGSGRILRHLLESGYLVTGVDISDEMLAVARQRLAGYLQKGTLKLLNHDFDQGTLAGSYTLGLVTYYTFNYVLDHPERFVKNLADSLFPHHSLLIDLFYPKTLHSPDLDGQWMRDTMQHNGKTVPYSEKRTWNAKKEIEERVQVFEEDGRKHEVVAQRRYYPPKKMTELLVKAGYQDISFCKGYEGHWQDSLAESSLGGSYVVRAKR